MSAVGEERIRSVFVGEASEEKIRKNEADRPAASHANAAGILPNRCQRCFVVPVYEKGKPILNEPHLFTVQRMYF